LAAEDIKPKLPTKGLNHRHPKPTRIVGKVSLMNPTPNHHFPSHPLPMFFISTLTPYVINTIPHHYLLSPPLVESCWQMGTVGSCCAGPIKVPPATPTPGGMDWIRRNSKVPLSETMMNPTSVEDRS
jgi:hypothetical protein